LSSYFDHELDAGSSVALDTRFYPDERFHGCGQAIRHELELAVRGNEGDGPVVLESGEADTLVELDILHLDGFAASS
jgi:hypothetical protein